MKIIFAGTPTFAIPALQALQHSEHQIVGVLTQPDRPAGRGQKLHESPVKQFAKAHHLPIWQPLTLRTATIQNTLRDLMADIMVVAAYGLLLPIDILNLTPYGAINIHASLLPRWRGAAPIQRAILAGDNETGITIMQMATGLDTGAMLAKINCSILATTTSAILHDQLAALGAQALLNVLTTIAVASKNAEIQSEALATYAHKIQKNEAIIDWRQSAIMIDRVIRAFNAGHTHLHGQALKIYQATPIAGQVATAAPGTIIQVNTNSLLVACGEGALQITQLQFAGGKLLAIAELLKSRQSLLTLNTLFSAIPS